MSYRLRLTKVGAVACWILTCFCIFNKHVEAGLDYRLRIIIQAKANAVGLLSSLHDL